MSKESTVSAAAAGTITIGGDLVVNRLGYGAMQLPGPGVWGPSQDPENALAVLRKAVDWGTNFIDTSDAYGPDVNEEQIAQALYPYPDGLVIATKGGLTRSGPGVWGRDARPERLKVTLDGSLKRLKLERIDLYQLHAPDEKVPFADQIGALVEMQAAGKIRHIGLSNVTVDELREALSIAEIVSVQNRYSAMHRVSEDVLVACERQGIAFLPWFPLDNGNASVIKAIEAAARAHNATVHQIALAWLLRRSPVMLPIPGTKSLEHLRENIEAASIQLTDAEFDAIGKA
jgi:pyridoxine 4-dehydrogenase